MVQPTFGLQFIREDDAPLPVLAANLDVVGIIGPCSTANSDFFPVNTPTLVNSNDTATLAQLGTDGYIPDAVNAINGQLADYQQAAQIVIVITPYGTADEGNLQVQQTIANIMGNSIARTGVWAFTLAPSLIYCTPRLICAPGYTGQMANSLDTLNIATVGTGYIPNQTYAITFVPGEDESNGAQLVLPQGQATADATGRINEDQLQILSYGAWMTVAPVATLPEPDGPAILAVSAAGQIVFTQQPNTGTTITLNGTEVTFLSAGATGATKSGNTLTGGATGIAATGWIAFNNNPSVGDNINIGGSQVSFVATGATGLQVNIGANLAATMTSLATMLNASSDSNLSLCSYTVSNGATLNIAAKATGAGGNAITLAYAITLSGDYLPVQANLTATIIALASLLNASTDTQIEANTYSASNGILNITSKDEGITGNGFAINTDVNGASISGSTLTGGQNAASAQQATLTTTIALGANPVVAALSGGVLDTLMGHAVVESSGVSQIADENWRDTIDSQRIIPCSGGVKVLNADGDVIVMPLAPRVIGLIVATDFRNGYPFHSAANTAISGIVGPARTISFSLLDGSTEGQELLAANLGIVVRGEIGVETAISSGGFVYIGTDTCSDDPLWQFYNITRGRDYIELSLIPAMRAYLGHNNIDAQTVANLLSTINVFLSTLKSLGQIYGYTCQFQGSTNTAAAIRAGHLSVTFAAEEPDPLRLITTYSQRYAPAIDAMIAQLQTQLNFAG